MEKTKHIKNDGEAVKFLKQPLKDNVIGKDVVNGRKNRRPVVVLLFGKYRDDDTEMLEVCSDEGRAAELLKQVLEPMRKIAEGYGLDIDAAADEIRKGRPYVSPDAKYWTERWSVK